jgi:hypothetical protein
MKSQTNSKVCKKFQIQWKYHRKRQNRYRQHTNTWSLTVLACICVSGCAKLEQWVIMYLCEWFCQARTVSDHVFVWVVVIIERDKIDTGSTQIHDRSLFWLGTTTHTNTLSLTVLAWYKHSHKYMIAHCSGLARTVSDHVFEWVVVPSQNCEQSCIFVSGCTKQEQWAIMYLWVFVPSQNS